MGEELAVDVQSLTRLVLPERALADKRRGSRVHSDARGSPNWLYEALNYPTPGAFEEAYTFTTTAAAAPSNHGSKPRTIALGVDARMSRKQPDLPDTDEGHAERLRRTIRRTQAVLDTGLAQDALAPTLGMAFHLTVQENTKTGTQAIIGLRRDLVDRPLLDQAATLTRVFTLGKESIYGPKVARSITHFSTTDHQKSLADQLKRMWEAQPFPRTYMMKSIGGTSVTPMGGLSDSTIGDRVLYSELVHADDASAVLEHVDDDEREGALSCLVGDRVALISHQEWIINAVRPDICPALTPWAGDHITIFRRLGSQVENE